MLNLPSDIDLIIYHKNCVDGLSAAYIAHTKYPDAELLPLNYGETLPVSVAGRKILMVDFCYGRDRDAMIELNNHASFLQVLDHHKTAEEKLKGLDFALFDMNRSGAGITWDALYGSEEGNQKLSILLAPMPRPLWVNYVEDADLWNWGWPESRYVANFLHSLPLTIEAWEGFAKWNDSKFYQTAAKQGFILQRQTDHYIDMVIQNARVGMWNGYKTAFINMPYPHISEACAQLLKNDATLQVAAGYFIRKDGKVQFSLRSRKEDDVDVSLIAKSYAGGGGHKSAAGFELDNAPVVIEGILDNTREKLRRNDD